MKIKKIKLITEDSKDVGGVTFTNDTLDQFPYIEATINSLDNNFNWWKENWKTLEQLIAQNLKKINKETTNIQISSRFTVFHGHDQKAKNIIWTGPSIVYTFENATAEIVSKIKDEFGDLYDGHKIFVDDNQLIVLFG